MALPINIVTSLQNIIRYDVGKYLDDYVVFIDNDKVNISNYYSGDVSRPNEQSFAELNRLLEESRKINSLIEVHKYRINTPEFWEIIEMLTEIDESLLTIDNSSKWLRSVITKNNFSPNAEVETVLKQFQTLENLAATLGSNSSDNDWIKIALRNDLREEDYTTEGGALVSISYQNKLRINIQSVVDNISGEKIYGIDLNKKLTFEGDDLQALSYKDTIIQTVDVLAGLRSGQTPEFPLDGIQIDLISGSNRASIAYPVLFRQFTSTFQKDDTLKSLLIKKIENIEDALMIEFEVETRFGETISTQAIF